MTKPKYVGSMFIETAKGVVEIGMMEKDGRICAGGVRDANTHRAPAMLPTVEQVRDALELAKWSIDHPQVFDGIAVL